MAFLDKFNDWYVRSIPETGPGISVTWMEPVAGARYRWKAAGATRWLVMLGIFAFLLLPLPGRNGSGPLPMPWRLVVATALTGVAVLFGWMGSQTPTRILLTARHVVIGTSRGAHRVALDTAHEVTLEQWAGYPVLVVTEAPGDQERIYLDPNCEGEIRTLLGKAGRLKSP